ncbi:IS66 family insertion sequence element accessory protein TnpA [Alicyclobacillus sendaiensis]|uniref:IS66 family insertion sequence element accessory protein TnpB n=1 Tax=Alicyclobacillus sendaiensis PA2 TaxID=3029425 RepID=A0ABT6Y0D5_ALISE|nr:IS66 family insertion sequence element accessory protein TnpB [Alicyclobacillus sendaiensis]MDI9260737.1 IS66 family insertion sequence element accessory protein TnpB [Alicyclobacillus sendaiensis PA2]
MEEHISHQERRELWRERIKVFYDGGQSASQFCAEHGLKPHQFWYWLGRLKLRNETSPGTHDTTFVSVVTTSSPSDAGRSPLTLRVGLVKIDTPILATTPHTCRAHSARDAGLLAFDWTSDHRTNLACGATDIRKSTGGFAALVQASFRLDPFSPCLLVLCNQHGTSHKIVHWSHNGF